jgi:hypothetical protein
MTLLILAKSGWNRQAMCVGQLRAPLWLDLPWCANNTAKIGHSIALPPDCLQFALSCHKI